MISISRLQCYSQMFRAAGVRYWDTCNTKQLLMIRRNLAAALAKLDYVIGRRIVD